MMDELVRLVSQKVGISEEQSRTAVNIVIGFLKDKMPAPIAGQIDAALGGGGIGKGLGGILGGK